MEIPYINVSASIEASVSLLHFIPISISSAEITNLNLSIIMESTADDGVHWQLKEQKAEVSFDTLNVTTDSSIVNTLVKWFNWAVKKTADDLLAIVPSMVDQQLQKINDIVVNEKQCTWDYNFTDNIFALNMTMTKNPTLEKGTRQIKLNFDGLFHDQMDPGAMA